VIVTVLTTSTQVPQADVSVDAGLHYEVEQFLFFEARLLDDRRFDEWWQLFTDDIHYWMPVRYNRQRRELDQETAQPDELAHFDEDKLSLYQRVYRLGTGMAWAEDPPSRTRHLITNVWVRHTDAEDELAVQSAFLVYRNRGDYEVDIWAGRRDDVIRRAGDSWQIANRKILIDQATILSKNLSIFF
jgi:3-phenylpropionate/cinnamic acid dioxygenase small subunit